MARPNKTGLDYFPIDLDIMDEGSVAFVDAKYGVAAFGILVRLLIRIYRNGYYENWSEREQYLFTKDVNVDIQQTQTIVSAYINEGFFNQKLFEQYGILTSRGIQKRYLKACDRRTKVAMFQEYFLLDPSQDDLKLDNVTLISVNADKNHTTKGISVIGMSAETPQRKENRKEIDSKENNTRAREGEPVDNFSPDDLLEGITLSEGSVRNDPDMDGYGEVAATDERDPDFIRFWNVYPKHGSESIAIEAWNTLLAQGIEAKHLILAANKYAAKVRMDKVEDRFIKHAHNFLLQGTYRDYLPLKITHCPSCKEYHRCKGQEWYWVDVDDGRGGVKQETVVCPYKAGVLNEPA